MSVPHSQCRRRRPRSSRSSAPRSRGWLVAVRIEDVACERLDRGRRRIGIEGEDQGVAAAAAAEGRELDSAELDRIAGDPDLARAITLVRDREQVLAGSRIAGHRHGKRAGVEVGAVDVRDGRVAADIERNRRPALGEARNIAGEIGRGRRVVHRGHVERDRVRTRVEVDPPLRGAAVILDLEGEAGIAGAVGIARWVERMPARSRRPGPARPPSLPDPFSSSVPWSGRVVIFTASRLPPSASLNPKSAAEARVPSSARVRSISACRCVVDRDHVDLGSEAQRVGAAVRGAVAVDQGPADRPLQGRGVGVVAVA